MSEWISVKDRLPEHDTDVLVFAEGKHEAFIGESVITITHIGNHKFWPDSPDHWEWVSPWQYFMTDYEITHWMPLPKPPERESIPVWWLKKMMSKAAVSNEDLANNIRGVLDVWDMRDVYDESK